MIKLIQRQNWDREQLAPGDSIIYNHNGDRRAIGPLSVERLRLIFNRVPDFISKQGYSVWRCPHV